MATIVRTTVSDQTTFGPVPLGSLPSGVIKVSVADIDDPSAELGLLSASTGQLLIAYNGDDFTVYAWTSSAVESIPRVVAGSTGFWVGICGAGVSSFNDAEGNPAAIGIAADGSSVYAARRDHVHAGSHTALSDIGTNTHSTIDTFISSKAAANGLASLGANTIVPTAQLGTGTADNTVYLRGDQTWQAVTGGVTFNDAEGDPANVGTTTDGTSTYSARRDHVHAAPDATTSVKGIASFSSTYFSVSGGAVSLIAAYQKAIASGVASLDGSSLVVQNPANATATATASKIPIADGSGTLDTWITDATTSVKGKASFSSSNFSVSSGAVSVKAQGISYSSIQNITATNRILGRVSSGAGTIEEITCTSAGRALLDDAAASDQRSTLGLGNSSTLDVGTTSGTVAAGNDSRLVSNGNSHDHSGGDGAQINHTTLSNIGTNTHSTIDTFISSKAAANGLASLGATTMVPTAQLGTGTANNTVYLRGDQTWQTVTAAPAGDDTQVQFKDGTVLGADAGMTYNKATDNFKLIATSAGAVTVPLTLHNNDLNPGTGVQINLVAYTDVATPTGKIIHKYDATTSYTTIFGVYPNYNTLYLTDTKLGLKVADPTYTFSFASGAIQSVGMERNTVSNTGGWGLEIYADGATVGSTNKGGGDILLIPGVSTGSASSGVKIFGGASGSSGTGDNGYNLLFEVKNNKIGFFGGTPVIKQTLAAYTSDPESSAYTTTGSGADIASKADLNALRAAYDNLRAMCEDLRTQITDTTLIALP